MSVVKNYIYSVLSGVLLTIIPIITIPYIARVLGKEYTGIHSFTFSIVQYFVMFGLMGTLTYGNRAIAYVRDDLKKRSKVFWEIFYLNFSLVFLTTIAYFIAVFALFDYNLRKYYIIQSINLFAAAVDITWFFYGMEEFKKTISRNMIIRITGAVLIFIFVKDSTHIWRYSVIIASSSLLGNLTLWMYVPKVIILQSIVPKKVLCHFIPSFKLFIPRIAVQVYTLLDKVMLGIMSTKAIVGIYELTTNITKMPLPLITSLGTVVMPRISFLFANNDHNKIKDYLNKTFKFQTYISLLLYFGITGVSFEFVPWYFGKGYELSVPLMCILSVTIIGISWSNVIGAQMMIPMQKEKEYTISLFIGAGINFLINLLLIPRYNAIGAAIGTAIAELVVAVSQLIFVRKILNIKELFKDIWKCFISGIAMLAIIRSIGLFSYSSILTTIIQISLGTIVYILILILLKSETNELLICSIHKMLKKKIK
ncbi:polysaccharide biosynthesis C-terminal domain-containing protein [Clostridium sp. SYSU_GA19001]|uniref:oligosaccharide flippase family protein n=1 Tax=Clostridium caldaquaticum TaxID=2940653 RepID=UPI002077446C|nr:polysaccharide biosynthesis C-terminal domain-containing protein [Clostridium caldaquaticum]MCM8711380.1 polysaccharide biosynthesis C-terminal domain-containing protein [Clostridium caldaquaticum]